MSNFKVTSEYNGKVLEIEIDGRRYEFTGKVGTEISGKECPLGTESLEYSYCDGEIDSRYWLSTCRKYLQKD